MAQTGQKYTEARRALLGSGDSGVPLTWPEDPLGWFTDQAYNAILLAADEARMLSHPRVEPEHLLLAAARRGNVEQLLAGAGIDAHAIYDAIVRVKGFGDRLELLPRRSQASQAVLRRAVTSAAERGVLGPSTEHLLIALGEEEFPAQILAQLGLGVGGGVGGGGDGVRALVDGACTPLPPVERSLIEARAAQLIASGRTPPSPGPIPPVFERFTVQARDAINAGIRHAREAGDPYVEPVHLLFGVLTASAGVVADVQAGWDVTAGLFAATQPRQPEAPGRHATGIFSQEARRIVAEDVLLVADRLGYRALTTGHILIAILEHPDENTSQIIGSIPGIRDVTAIIDALPGQEDL